MIRINLSDFRLQKMKLYIKVEALGMFLLIIMCCAFLYVLNDSMTITRDSLLSDTKLQEKHIAEQRKKVSKVILAEKKIKRVEQILKDIDALKVSIEDPSYFFDELRIRIPGTVWITQMIKNPDQLSLNGFAESQSDLADLLTRLESHYKLESVELGESIRQQVHGKSYYKFSIDAPFKPSENESADAKEKS